MTWMGALAVFIGGGLGSLARFGMSALFKTLDLAHLPFATLASNILSCVIVGWIALRFAPPPQSTIYLFIAIGFCGGFSTFSTFSLETLQLMRNGHMIWAVANVVVSIIACISLLYMLSKPLE